MKAQVLATSIESTEYMALQLADLEAVMTPEEREAALVKGWLIRGVEPGADEVFSFRIAAEYAPADIDQLIFQPLEIDCRSVTGRAWVRNGQTKGSLDATITFQAVAVSRVEMNVILQEQQRRQQQVKASNERRTVQRDYLSRLRIRIEDRLKGGADAAATPTVASANSAKGR